MELFTKLFGALLVFVYHCFDRIVIHGYLSGLSRPAQVVYFFRRVLGLAAVDKEVLSRRTTDYQQWVEAFARNHALPIEWAESGVRKEDHVRPGLKRMEKNRAWGVYFLFKSMEQGRTFRISQPKFPTKDPHHRILAHQRSRHTHYYFYIRDEVLGPFAMRMSSFFPFQATYYLNGHSFMERELERAQVKFRKNDNAFLAVDDVAQLQAAADRFNSEIIRQRLDYWTHLLGPKFSAKEGNQMNLSRFYAIAQIEYCRNFIFKRHFPIHKIFERGCELGLWRLTAHKISEIFGMRLTRKFKGKLANVVEPLKSMFTVAAPTGKVAVAPAKSIATPVAGISSVAFQLQSPPGVTAGRVTRRSGDSERVKGGFVGRVIERQFPGAGTTADRSDTLLRLYRQNHSPLRSDPVDTYRNLVQPRC